MNAKMSELKKCFEKAGFTNVVTVLSSGNVVFDARSGSIATLEKKIESAMGKDLPQGFMTIVRSVESLRKILEGDPFKNGKLGPKSKRIVTFLKAAPKAKMKLPISVDGATILKLKDQEVYSHYVPSPKGPVFMSLIEKTFGKEVTTRTWDTVKKVVSK